MLADNQSRKNILIIGISSDIGINLAQQYLADGHCVIGTYRSNDFLKTLPSNSELKLLQCDINNPESIKIFCHKYRALALPWDILISSVGTLEPIGRFFNSDFDDWEKSVMTNSTSQLRLLHGIYPERRMGEISQVIFFAGGGTNGPFRNYSAYCIAKIALIKMCELLDDETDDLNICAIGTGFVRTKIHQQTLKNPDNAGNNYNKTMDFLNSKDEGTSMSEIYQCINWCISQGKSIAGGRNFAIVHDPWGKEDSSFADWLQEDTNRFKLRRLGNEHYNK